MNILDWLVSTGLTVALIVGAGAVIRIHIARTVRAAERKIYTRMNADREETKARLLALEQGLVRLERRVERNQTGAQREFELQKRANDAMLVVLRGLTRSALDHEERAPGADDAK